MRLVAVQMNIVEGNPAENLDTLREMLETAKIKGNEFVCLPELINTGYNWNAIRAVDEDSCNAFVDELGNLARKYSISLVGGSIAEADGDLRFNTSYIFSPEGDVIGKYRKAHLFSVIDEDRYFAEGADPVVVDIDGVKVGVAICYDLRFPELFRRMILDGAEIIALPAQWPLKRAHIWRTLSIARAIENQCVFLAVNRAGIDRNVEEYGLSLIVNPWGSVIADAKGSGACIISAEYDLSEVEKAREAVPALRERRPDVYRLDWEIAGEITPENPEDG
ncbi:carbon-nitrogen family hydrolase [bacterium]|nr:carbon-nitrogen family hydrolase [bacterium]